MQSLNGGMTENTEAAESDCMLDGREPGESGGDARRKRLNSGGRILPIKFFIPCLQILCFPLYFGENRVY